MRDVVEGAKAPFLTLRQLAIRPTMQPRKYTLCNASFQGADGQIENIVARSEALSCSRHGESCLISRISCAATPSTQSRAATPTRTMRDVDRLREQTPFLTLRQLATRLTPQP
jgi:hypothetical protein